MIRKNKSINPFSCVIRIQKSDFFYIFWLFLALFGSFWLFLALFLDILGIFTISLQLLTIKILSIQKPKLNHKSSIN